MVFLIIIILGVALAASSYNQHYADKYKADRAKRLQDRVIEAKKGYKNLGPNKPTDVA